MQGMTPVSGVFPTDDSLHQLEIRIQANSAFAISRGSRSTSLHTPEHDHCFPSMLLSPSPFQIQVSHQTQEYFLQIPPNLIRDTTERLVAH
jgi:hypothetical protein